MNLLFLRIGFGEYFITGADSEQGHPENMYLTGKLGHPENMYLTGKESGRQRCQELYSNSVTSLNHENPYNFLSCQVQEEHYFLGLVDSGPWHGHTQELLLHNCIQGRKSSKGGNVCPLLLLPSSEPILRT